MNAYTIIMHLKELFDEASRLRGMRHLRNCSTAR